MNKGKDMKLVHILIICLLSSFFVGCNEEIADEIKNTSDISGKNDIDFENKSIRLVHKMRNELSFYMHKEGTIDQACELSAPALGFNAEDYRKSDKNYAIDCVLEAQELDLYFQGVEFEVQVDDFLCEYVRYKPFRFMQFQPGSTVRTVYNVSCDSVCADQRPADCDKTYLTANGGIDDGDPFVSGVTFTDADGDAATTCNYDYSDTTGFPNCDEGTINIINRQLVAIGEKDILDDDGNPTGETEPDCSTDADVGFREQASSRNKCGGDHLNCLEGPALQDLDPELSSLIFDNIELNELTEEFSYEAPINREDGTNRYLANYSRICSSTTSDKNADGVYENLLFKGFEVEGFRNTAGSLTETYDDNGDGLTDRISFASSSFRSAYSTSPYYAFECLDKAYDVKAQIRLFIREWDREFSETNIYLSKVSDIDTSSGEPKMDNNDFYDTDMPWNDAGDWDDFYSTNNVFTNDRCELEVTEHDQFNNFIRGSI